MSFDILSIQEALRGPLAAGERFWGLGPVGLGVVIFLVIFIAVVVAWLIHNTGRWD